VPTRLHAAFAVILLCSAASAAPARRSIAVLAPSGGGLDADTAKLVEELVVGSLDATGRFKVTSRSDMASVLGFEKQKQTPGLRRECLVHRGDRGRAGRRAARRAPRRQAREPHGADALDHRRAQRHCGRPGAAHDGLAHRTAGSHRRDGGRDGGGGDGGRTLGAKTWIAAGAALAAAGAGTYFALSARSEAKTRDTTMSAAEYDRAQGAAEAAVFRTNVAWGVAGAAGIAAGLLFVFQF